MDQWLKRGSLSTKSSTAIVSKGVTDFGSESQSFTSLSTLSKFTELQIVVKTEVQ